MKTKTLHTLLLAILLLNGCGTDDSKKDSNSSSTSSSGYKAVAPLRYLAENYKTLSDGKIAKYLNALSDKDKDNLGRYYTSLASYLQHQACNADPSIIVMQEPQITYINPIPLSCQDNDAYIQNFIYLLQIPPSNYQTGDEFKSAYSDADKMIVTIKCDTGEIDAGTCTLYNNIQLQAQENSNNFYQQMHDSNSEFTRQLAEQCSYDGETLSNGAICVL